MSPHKIFAILPAVVLSCALVFSSCVSDADHAAALDAAKAEAREEGYNFGYSLGLDDGYTNGKADGYDDGHDKGYKSGYDEGYTTGSSDGYDRGHSDGYSVGYDSGYTDGCADASGFEDPVYITLSGSKYHRYWCSYLSSSSILTSRENAISRGYSPCSRCKP